MHPERDKSRRGFWKGWGRKRDSIMEIKMIKIHYILFWTVKNKKKECKNKVENKRRQSALASDLSISTLRTYIHNKINTNIVFGFLILWRDTMTRSMLIKEKHSIEADLYLLRLGLLSSWWNMAASKQTDTVLERKLRVLYLNNRK